MTDRRFQWRMRNSAQIDTPLSSRAYALWRSFFLPFYRPTHSLCACLSACFYDMSHSFRTFLLFFWLLKGYESNIKSSDRLIDWPLLRMRGWFLWAMPPAYRVKVHKCASFLDKCVNLQHYSVTEKQFARNEAAHAHLHDVRTYIIIDSLPLQYDG